MPKSTNIAKYPPGMLELLESVCHTGEPCVIPPFPDAATARKERFEFYGLIRALEVSGHTLAEQAKQLTFSLSGEKKNILTITMGQVIKSDFYTQLADKHRSQHPAVGPSLGDQAVAALKAEQEKH